MVDLVREHRRIAVIGREGKALQRCTLSARSMPGDGQEHRLRPVLLPSHPSSGPKAQNLLSWGAAPTQAKDMNYLPPVGHVSTLVVRWSIHLPTLPGRPGLGVALCCQARFPGRGARVRLRIRRHVTQTRLPFYAKPPCPPGRLCLAPALPAIFAPAQQHMVAHRAPPDQAFGTSPRADQQDQKDHDDCDRRPGQVL